MTGKGNRKTATLGCCKSQRSTKFDKIKKKPGDNSSKDDATNESQSKGTGGLHGNIFQYVPNC